MTAQVSGAIGLGHRLSVWLIGIVTNAVLGAVTILIDTQISHIYFARYFELRLEVGIRAGLAKGAVFGGLAALIFADVAARIARTPGGYGLAVRHVNAITLIAFVGWVLGGFSTVVFTALRPDLYERTFHGVPKVGGILLGYAWVDGSLCGMALGWLISPVLALLMFRRTFLRTQQLSARNDAQPAESSYVSTS